MVNTSTIPHDPSDAPEVLPSNPVTTPGPSTLVTPPSRLVTPGSEDDAAAPVRTRSTTTATAPAVPDKKDEFGLFSFLQRSGALEGASPAQIEKTKLTIEKLGEALDKIDKMFPGLGKMFKGFLSAFGSFGGKDGPDAAPSKPVTQTTQQTPQQLDGFAQSLVNEFGNLKNATPEGLMKAFDRVADTMFPDANDAQKAALHQQIENEIFKAAAEGKLTEDGIKDIATSLSTAAQGLHLAIKPPAQLTPQQSYDTLSATLKTAIEGNPTRAEIKKSFIDAIDKTTLSAADKQDLKDRVGRQFVQMDKDADRLGIKDGFQPNDAAWLRQEILRIVGEKAGGTQPVPIQPAPGISQTSAPIEPLRNRGDGDFAWVAPDGQVLGSPKDAAQWRKAYDDLSNGRAEDPDGVHVNPLWFDSHKQQPQAAAPAQPAAKMEAALRSSLADSGIGGSAATIDSAVDSVMRAVAPAGVVDRNAGIDRLIAAMPDQPVSARDFPPAAMEKALRNMSVQLGQPITPVVDARIKSVVEDFYKDGFIDRGDLVRLNREMKEQAAPSSASSVSRAQQPAAGRGTDSLTQRIVADGDKYVASQVGHVPEKHADAPVGADGLRNYDHSHETGKRLEGYQYIAAKQTFDLSKADDLKKLGLDQGGLAHMDVEDGHFVATDRGIGKESLSTALGGKKIGVEAVLDHENSVVAFRVFNAEKPEEGRYLPPGGDGILPLETRRPVYELVNEFSKAAVAAERQQPVQQQSLQQQSEPAGVGIPVVQQTASASVPKVQ